jgi:gluconolactonase
MSPTKSAFALMFILITIPTARALDTLEDLVAGEVSLVKDGFEFTEGPAADAAGNLFFTDIPAEQIHRLDVNGEFSSAIHPSQHTNGLMFDAAGKLLGCQMDGQVVCFDLAKKTAVPIADTFEKMRFNAPNDLTIDKEGGVYFTDPLFRAPNPLPQTTMGVYYRDPAGVVHRVATDLPAPNGIGLSADEKSLYVIPSQSAEMLVFPVESPGKLGPQRVFCTLKQPDDQPASRPGGGDGMTLDERGNLYIAAATGLQVFAPSGEYIGTIAVPQQPANAAFGGSSGKTLYLTARTGLYRVEMKVVGQKTKGIVPLK